MRCYDIFTHSIWIAKWITISETYPILYCKSNLTKGNRSTSKTSKPIWITHHTTSQYNITNCPHMHSSRYVHINLNDIPTIKKQPSSQTLNFFNRNACSIVLHAEILSMVVMVIAPWCGLASWSWKMEPGPTASILYSIATLPNMPLYFTEGMEPGNFQAEHSTSCNGTPNYHRSTTKICS